MMDLLFPTPFLGKYVAPVPEPFTTAWKTYTNWSDFSGVYSNHANAQSWGDETYAYCYDNYCQNGSDYCFWTEWDWQDDLSPDATILGLEIEIDIMPLMGNGEILHSIGGTDMGYQYHSQTSSYGTRSTFVIGGPNDLAGYTSIDPSHMMYDGFRIGHSFRVSSAGSIGSGRVYGVRARVHGEALP